MNLPNKIPHFFSRFSLEISSILFIPFVFYLFLFFIENNKINSIQKKIYLLEKKTQEETSSATNDQTILCSIQDCSPSYVENFLENLPFLKRETQKWKIHTAQITPTEKVKKRIEFLDGSINRLQFVEEKKYKNPLFVETKLRQKKSVEVNEEDLKTILSRIEGVPIGTNQIIPKAPQLMITFFSLEKKPQDDLGDRNYILHMDLIKREALK